MLYTMLVYSVLYCFILLLCILIFSVLFHILASVAQMKFASYFSFPYFCAAKVFAVIAQLVERWLPKPKVAGSSPVYRSRFLEPFNHYVEISSNKLRHYIALVISFCVCCFLSVFIPLLGCYLTKLTIR